MESARNFSHLPEVRAPGIYLSARLSHNLREKSEPSDSARALPGHPGSHQRTQPSPCGCLMGDPGDRRCRRSARRVPGRSCESPPPPIGFQDVTPARTRPSGAVSRSPPASRCETIVSSSCRYGADVQPRARVAKSAPWHIDWRGLVAIRPRVVLATHSPTAPSPPAALPTGIGGSGEPGRERPLAQAKH